MKQNNANGKDKMSLLEKLYLKLDIPPDIINGMLIEIRGRTYMRIHGCREILLYTPEQIKIRLQECVLQILGKELHCTAFNSKSVEIDGVICSIALDAGGKLS